MQQLLQNLMSGPDIFKIVMLVGIALAIPLNVWLSKSNKKLSEENRRSRERIERDSGERASQRRAASA